MLVSLLQLPTCNCHKHFCLDSSMGGLGGGGGGWVVIKVIKIHKLISHLTPSRGRRGAGGSHKKQNLQHDKKADTGERKIEKEGEKKKNRVQFPKQCMVKQDILQNVPFRHTSHDWRFQLIPLVLLDTIPFKQTDGVQYPCISLTWVVKLLLTLSWGALQGNNGVKWWYCWIHTSIFWHNEIHTHTQKKLKETGSVQTS